MNYTTTGIIGEVPPSKRPAIFLGDTKKRLRQMPESVRKDIGVALDIAQYSEKPNAAKPLRGFGGAGVLEIIDDYDGDTYRAVYTVQLVHDVHVLHAFQKKSKTGSKLGVGDPDGNLARAAIARQIERLLNELGLTQAEIGKQLKLPQSAVSRLVNGRYRDFSTDRLMRILLRLGRDIEITIRPAPKRRTEGHLTVKAA